MICTFFAGIFYILLLFYIKSRSFSIFDNHVDEGDVTERYVVIYKTGTKNTYLFIILQEYTAKKKHISLAIETGSPVSHIIFLTMLVVRVLWKMCAFF